MRFVVLVRSAMASTRAPLKPIAANSSVAMSMMFRLVCSGSYFRLMSGASPERSRRTGAATLLAFFIVNCAEHLRLTNILAWATGPIWTFVAAGFFTKTLVSRGFAGVSLYFRRIFQTPAARPHKEPNDLQASPGPRCVGLQFDSQADPYCMRYCRCRVCTALERQRTKRARPATVSRSDTAAGSSRGASTDTAKSRGRRRAHERQHCTGSRRYLPHRPVEDRPVQSNDAQEFSRRARFRWRVETRLYGSAIHGRSLRGDENQQPHRVRQGDR